MIQSKHEERWPMVELLTGLGWPQHKIAQAIGWSEGTVVNDQRRHGGVKKIAPNRPNTPEKVYAVTFAFWASEPEISISVMEAIERELEIEKIQGGGYGISAGLDQLCQKIYPNRFEPYFNLMRAIFGERGEEELVFVPHLKHLKKSVREGTIPAPVSTKEAIRWLA